MSEPTYTAPAVDSAARILEHLSRYRTRNSTLTEISAALNLSKSTALRILRTLDAHGLVSYNPESKRYSLGYFTVVLGARAEESLDILGRVRPFMEELTDKTGHTVALVQKVTPDRLMYVFKLDGVGPGTVHVSVGNRFPLFEVSYGKWYVAFADPAARDAMVPKVLPQVTPDTRTKRAEYLKECADLTAGSVVVSRNEYVAGVLTVSCPVLGARGDIEGVLVLLAVSDNVNDSRERDLRDLVEDIAKRCNSQVLGV